MLPVPVILHAMQMIGVARAREAHANATVRRTEIQASIRALEIEAETMKIQAHKDIILATIEAVQSFEEKKIDAYNMAFNVMKNHIEARRASVEDARRDVRDLRRKTSDPDERVALRAQLSDLNHEAEQLTSFLEEAHRQHTFAVQSARLSFSANAADVPRLPSAI